MRHVDTNAKSTLGRMRAMSYTVKLPSHISKALRNGCEESCTTGHAKCTQLDSFRELETVTLDTSSPSMALKGTVGGMQFRTKSRWSSVPSESRCPIATTVASALRDDEGVSGRSRDCFDFLLFKNPDMLDVSGVRRTGNWVADVLFCASADRVDVYEHTYMCDRGGSPVRCGPAACKGIDENLPVGHYHNREPLGVWGISCCTIGCTTWFHRSDRSSASWYSRVLLQGT